MAVFTDHRLVFKKGGPHDYPEWLPVFGWYFRHRRTIYLSFIDTRSTGHEGRGLVRGILEAAREQADTIVVPTVMSERLLGMLIRRGFKVERQNDKTLGVVECMVWRR